MKIEHLDILGGSYLEEKLNTPAGSSADFLCRGLRQEKRRS
jgi:hypothetical protein